MKNIACWGKVENSIFLQTRKNNTTVPTFPQKITLLKKSPVQSSPESSPVQSRFQSRFSKWPQQIRLHSLCIPHSGRMGKGGGGAENLEEESWGFWKKRCVVIKSGREVGGHVYAKRQTSDKLRISQSRRHIKTVQNNSYVWNWRETTHFLVEVINSQRQLREKLGHVVQIHVCRLA